MRFQILDVIPFLAGTQATFGNLIDIRRAPIGEPGQSRTGCLFLAARGFHYFEGNVLGGGNFQSSECIPNSQIQIIKALPLLFVLR